MSLPHPAPDGADEATARSRVLALHDSRFGRAAELCARAPGRVNLLGAHVDYSEGWVMPAALDRSLWLAASPRDDGRMVLVATDLDEQAELDLAALPPVRADRADDRTSWIDVPAGVAWALAERGLPLRGMNVAFGGDLPMGAGVSSSAAVEVAFVLAFEALSGDAEADGWTLSGVDKALVGRRTENAYLGVGSGVMDQYASLHGQAGHVVFLDCRTLRHELLPLPPGTTVLVTDTGVRRRLVDGHLDDRRSECERAVEILARHRPGITALRDATLEDLAAVALEPVLARRARHVIEECGRVLAGAAALRAGDAADFGRLVSASHDSSRDLYEVAIPELDVLAVAARGVPGCHGARLTGAGFGGCITSLVDGDAVPRVREALDRAFESAFARRPEHLPCRVGDGAGIERLALTR